MGKVTLETLSRQLAEHTTQSERQLESIDHELKNIDQKLSEHDDLLTLSADTVSRHDDDLTYLKRTLRHQRV
jgi:hypothetical protein